MAITFNPACDSCTCAGGDITYLGGDFTSVGGVSRGGLAKLASDGSVNADWNASTDDAVFAMVLDSGTLYIGGRFTQVAGTARAGLAAIDATTGLLLSWNPGISGGGAAVYGMTIDAAAGILYIVGDFTNLGGSARNRAGAVSTAGVLQAWDPNLNGVAWDVELATDLYLVGEFTTVSGGTARNRGAAFTTGGVLQTWNPNITHASSTAIVYEVAINGSSIYVGGFFNRIGGVARNNLGETDSAGTLQAFDPNMNNDVRRISIDATAGLLYVIGDFTTVGGTTRNRACALDATGSLGTWDANLSAFSRSILKTTDNVYVGGNFTTASSQVRNRAAAFATDSTLRDWNPDCDSVPYVIIAE